MNPWYPMNDPLTVNSRLSAIGRGSSRSCAVVIRDALDKLCISEILFPSRATDVWWLITTNPTVARIARIVMTTISSTRVNQEVLLKDKTPLVEEDDLKGIISREWLREKRDIETLLIKFCLLLHHTFAQNTNIHTRRCLYWVDKFWIYVVI